MGGKGAVKVHKLRLMYSMSKYVSYHIYKAISALSKGSYVVTRPTVSWQHSMPNFGVSVKMFFGKPLFGKK